MSDQSTLSTVSVDAKITHSQSPQTNLRLPRSDARSECSICQPMVIGTRFGEIGSSASSSPRAASRHADSVYGSEQCKGLPGTSRPTHSLHLLEVRISIMICFTSNVFILPPLAPLLSGRSLGLEATGSNGQAGKHARWVDETKGGSEIA